MSRNLISKAVKSRLTFRMCKIMGIYFPDRSIPSEKAHLANKMSLRKPNFRLLWLAYEFIQHTAMMEGFGSLFCGRRETHTALPREMLCQASA